MQILAISDLHGNSVDGLLDIPDVDTVFVLGDITTGGSLGETKERILALQDVFPVVFTIPGNWEKPDSIRWLEQEGLSLHGKGIQLGNVHFFGAGGSIPTPFNTPNEMSEEEFSRLLGSCPQSPESRLVILSHTPPYGACDKVFLGTHVGSKALRAFIEKRKPHLVLCGHIHEARGVDKIESTLVVNPGTAPKHYALVELAEEISVKLN